MDCIECLGKFRLIVIQFISKLSMKYTQSKLVEINSIQEFILLKRRTGMNMNNYLFLSEVWASNMIINI